MVDDMLWLTTSLVVAMSTADRVSVEIMAESYCPCAGAWEAGWQNDMLPKIGEIATLSRFFDAKKNGTQACCNPSAGADASCMHTKSECVADTLQRCVQAYYPKVWLEFTNCISGPCGGSRPDVLGCKYQFDIGQPKNLAREQICAQNLTVNWTTITTCWRGAEGVQLMQGDADKSDSVEPRYGLAGLPVVWINGQLFSHFFDCRFAGRERYQHALLEAICAASGAAVLPEACKSKSAVLFQ